MEGTRFFYRNYSFKSAASEFWRPDAGRFAPFGDDVVDDVDVVQVFSRADDGPGGDKKLARQAGEGDRVVQDQFEACGRFGFDGGDLLDGAGGKAL